MAVVLYGASTSSEGFKRRSIMSNRNALSDAYYSVCINTYIQVEDDEGNGRDDVWTLCSFRNNVTRI